MWTPSGNEGLAIRSVDKVEVEPVIKYNPNNLGANAAVEEEVEEDEEEVEKPRPKQNGHSPLKVCMNQQHDNLDNNRFDLSYLSTLLHIHLIDLNISVLYAV